MKSSTLIFWNIPDPSEGLLEQAHIGLAKASLDENLKVQIKYKQHSTVLRKQLPKLNRKDRIILKPGSVIVSRRAPPLQYTPTWPSGTWCIMDKLFLRVEDVGIISCKFY